MHQAKAEPSCGSGRLAPDCLQASRVLPPANDYKSILRRTHLCANGPRSRTAICCLHDVSRKRFSRSTRPANFLPAGYTGRRILPLAGGGTGSPRVALVRSSSPSRRFVRSGTSPIFLARLRYGFLQSRKAGVSIPSYEPAIGSLGGGGQTALFGSARMRNTLVVAVCRAEARCSAIGASEAGLRDGESPAPVRRTTCSGGVWSGQVEG
jgi:hypothetical protein